MSETRATVRGRLRATKRWQRLVAGTAAAAIALLGGVAVSAGSASAAALPYGPGFIYTPPNNIEPDHLGAYVYSFTGGSKNSYCINAGDLAPQPGAPATVTTVVAPIDAYMYATYGASTSDMTQAAIAFNTHNHSDLSVGAMGTVSWTEWENAASAGQLPGHTLADVKAAETQAALMLADALAHHGPYTITGTTVNNGNGSYTATFTVRSPSTGNAVPNVVVQLAKTGQTTQIGSAALTTNSAGQVAVRFLLNPSTTGGVSASASMAGVTVSMASPSDTSTQRMLSASATPRVTISSSVSAARPALPTSKVTLFKHAADTGKAQAGTVWQFLSNGTVYGSASTNAAGQLTITVALPAGTKGSLHEVSAEPGYALTPDIAVTTTTTAAATGTGHVNAVDARKVANNITVTKLDTVTGLPVTDGAQFTASVVKSGTTTKVQITGGAANGTGTVSPGHYTTATAGLGTGKVTLTSGSTTPKLTDGDSVTFTEFKAGPDHLTPLTPLTVTGIIGNDGNLSVTATNSPQRSFQLLKVSSDGVTPLAGAVGIACYTLNGRAWAPGEKAAAKPCLVPAGTGTANRAGGTFDLSKYNAIGTFDATGADGKSSVLTSPWVRPGDTVIVLETGAPVGFALSDTAAFAAITVAGYTGCSSTSAGSTHKSAAVLCTISDQPVPVITFTKRIIDPVTKAPVVGLSAAGAFYKIAAADGTVLVASAGPTDIAGHFTAKVPGAAAGQMLTLTEIIAPAGAKLDPAPFYAPAVATSSTSVLITAHQDDQQIPHPPVIIGTALVNAKNGSNSYLPGDTGHDTMTYTGQPGTVGTAVGTASCITPAGVQTLIPGATGTTTFTVPASGTGTVTVSITLPKTMAACTVTVDEKWLINGTVVAEHNKNGLDTHEQGHVYIPVVTVIGAGGAATVDTGLGASNTSSTGDILTGAAGLLVVGLAVAFGLVWHRRRSHGRREQPLS